MSNISDEGFHPIDLKVFIHTKKTDPEYKSIRCIFNIVHKGINDSVKLKRLFNKYWSNNNE